MFLLNALYDFVYPPFCQQCQSTLDQGETRLCSLCLMEMDLVEPAMRCSRCFRSREQYHRCPSSFLSGLFACCETSTVCYRLLLSDPHLYAGFLLHQWARLSWPIPDLLAITPGSPHVDRLYGHRKRATQELSYLWGIPARWDIGLHHTNLSNPYNSLEEQQEHQDPKAIYINSSHLFVNKRVLIIHDVLRTGVALESTAQALRSIGALEVYGLSILYDP